MIRPRAWTRSRSRARAGLQGRAGQTDTKQRANFCSVCSVDIPRDITSLANQILSSASLSSSSSSLPEAERRDHPQERLVPGTTHARRPVHQRQPRSRILVLLLCIVVVVVVVVSFQPRKARTGYWCCCCCCSRGNGTGAVAACALSSLRVGESAKTNEPRFYFFKGRLLEVVVVVVVARSRDKPAVRWTGRALRRRTQGRENHLKGGEGRRG